MSLIKSALPKLLCSACRSHARFSPPVGNFTVTADLASWAASPVAGYSPPRQFQLPRNGPAVPIPLLPLRQLPQQQQRLLFRGFATVTAATAQGGSTSTQKSLKKAENSDKGAADRHQPAGGASAAGVKEEEWERADPAVAPAAFHDGVQLHAVRQTAGSGTH